MTSVSRKDGFRYGFYVFAYWLVLLAVGTALVAAGGILVTVRNEFSAVPSEALVVLGGFVGFLGVVLFGAGQTGLVYKVIADGVTAGVRSGGAGNWHPAESTAVEESGAAVPAGSAEPVAGDRHGSETVQENDQPGGPASTTAEPPEDVPDEPEDAGSPDDAGDGPAVAGTAGDEDSSAERDATDAFESGGFEPARPAAEADDPDPENSPADVASESEIAEELGFGDRETGDVSDAETTIVRDESGRDAGDDPPPPADDPLAPDSATEPVATDDRDEPDRETWGTSADAGDPDPDWTTGENHMGSSASTDDRDGHEG